MGSFQSIDYSNLCISSIVYGDKAVVEEVVSTTILKLYIEKPDIILVEKMDDINCYALILNVSNK